LTGFRAAGSTRGLAQGKPNYPQIEVVEATDKTIIPPGDSPMSFVDRVKVYGANALLGHFTSKGGFDKCVEDLRVEKISSGVVECSFPVTPKTINTYGTLHGLPSSSSSSLLAPQMRLVPSFCSSSLTPPPLRPK